MTCRYADENYCREADLTAAKAENERLRDMLEYIRERLVTSSGRHFTYHEWEALNFTWRMKDQRFPGRALSPKETP